MSVVRLQNYSLCYPTFHNEEKECQLIKDVLRKLKFKLLYKKPIFEKKVKKIEYKGILKFKYVNTKINKFKCLNMYKSALKNTPFPSEYLDSLNPKFYFNKYILNKDKKLNFIIYYQNKVAGFVTIHVNTKRKYGYIGFITLLKKYRGKGLSYDILTKVENEFYIRSVKRWLESTDQFNKPMIKCFKKYGFKKIRYLLGYVYNSEIGFKRFIKK